MQPNRTPKSTKTKRIKQMLNCHYNGETQELNLDDCGDYWRSVLEFRNWSALRILKLSGCDIGDSGAEFVGSLSWPNLRYLSIGRNQITAVGVYKLLNRKFPQLEQLNLDDNKIEDEGMQVLSTAQQLPLLQILRVGGNNFSAVGMGMMPNWRLGRIKELVLGNYSGSNNIGSVGIKLLIKAQLPLLHQLYLTECELGDEGAKHLAKSNWPNLQFLEISGNRSKLDGCAAITGSSWKRLKNITVCYLSDNVGVVVVVGLVAVNWPSSSKVYCDFDSNLNLKRDVKYIVLSRFSQQEGKKVK